MPAPRRLSPVITQLVNDLEPAAEALEPRLVEFRNALEAATGAPALLAGSGSAYVVPIADARRIPALVDAVSRRIARAGRRHDERQPRRPPRQLTLTRSPARLLASFWRPCTATVAVEGRRDAKGDELAALLTALPARLLEKLLVLLLPHALAALLDQ